MSRVPVRWQCVATADEQRQAFDEVLDWLIEVEADSRQEEACNLSLAQ